MENETKQNKFCEWEVREEKNVWDKKKENIAIILGVTCCVLAVIFDSYLFAVVIAFSTFILVTLGRKTPGILHFLITEKGFKVDDKFYPAEDIEAFNIIDDPTDKGRLTVSVAGFIGQVTVPIYDADMKLVEECFVEMKIKKDEGLKTSFLERCMSFF